MFYLFYLGRAAVKLYWVMVGLGIGAGFILFYFQAKAKGLPKRKIISFYLLGTLFVLIGTRLFYLLSTKPVIFFREPAKIFSLTDIYWEGGVSVYGGVLGGFLFMLWFCRRNKIPVWKLADLVTPSIILAVTLVRLGCFFNGCCYGKPTDLAWGMVFRDPRVFAPKNILLHPVQLYEAGGNLILFLYFWRKRKDMKFPGELSLKYAFVYNALRIITEFFKHPVFRYRNSPFTFSQFLALGILIASALTLRMRGRKNPSTPNIN